jgi:hypothetical protein
MKQTTVPMKNDAKLIIKAGGDILIEGVDQAQLVAIVDDGDSFRLKDDGKGILVRTDSDAKLSVPRGASVTIESAGGDAGVMNLNGMLIVQRVGGDLTIQSVNGIVVDSVGGDCFFKEVSGSVEINRVGGDLDGYKAVTVKARKIGGDIELSDISQSVDLEADGDVHLQFSASEIGASRVHADGDINLEVNENCKAILNMTSHSESISVQACGQHLDLDEETYALPLGEGGAAVELFAEGEISVGEGKDSTNEFSFVFEDLGKSWHDFGKEIEEKIRHSMKGVNHSLKQAGWQASEAMKSATEKMQGFPFSGEFNKEGRVYGFSFDNKPGSNVKPEKKGVSDEERMMVLKMLQEKKISVEEAEKLLQALEG